MQLYCILLGLSRIRDNRHLSQYVVQTRDAFNSTQLCDRRINKQSDQGYGAWHLWQTFISQKLNRSIKNIQQNISFTQDLVTASRFTAGENPQSS